MTDTRTSVFFYGSFINLGVLAGSGLVPENIEIARLAGYDICIAPLATLVRSDRHSVYGLLCTAQHEALQHLYGQEWVAAYRPEAVIVETRQGRMTLALCWIAPPFMPAPATDDYIDRITGPARDFGFPAWYIERLESFRGGATR
jgi:hypothetical protein